LEKGLDLALIEFKSGQTIVEEDFKNITYWQGISRGISSKAFVVYGGKEEQIRANCRVLGWERLDLGELFG
jgi:hypothetical protein